MRPTGHMTTAQESGSLSGKPRRGNHAQPSCVNQVSVGALMLYPGAATACVFSQRDIFLLKQIYLLPLISYIASPYWRGESKALSHIYMVRVPCTCMVACH